MTSLAPTVMRSNLPNSKKPDEQSNESIGRQGGFMLRAVTAAAAAVVIASCLTGVASPTGSTWPPSGYTSYSNQIAYKSTGGPCAYRTHRCWTLLFVARTGCPNGLYVTLNIFRGNVLVGDAIDVAYVLPPRTPARLTFAPTVSGHVARFGSVNCYD